MLEITAKEIKLKGKHLKTFKYVDIRRSKIENIIEWTKTKIRIECHIYRKYEDRIK